MLALFLAITPEKIKHVQDLENKTKLKRKLLKKRSTVYVNDGQRINQKDFELNNQINMKLDEIIKEE